MKWKITKLKSTYKNKIKLAYFLRQVYWDAVDRLSQISKGFGL
jgi:hypothetical protein